MTNYKDRPAYNGWLERKKQRLNKQRADWKAAGKCVRCGGERDSKFGACIVCRIKGAKQRGAKAQERREKGLCATCGKVPAADGFKTCDNCRGKLDLESRRKGTMEWRKQLQKETLEAYGGKCECCNEEEPLFLAIDHINNDGSKQRESLKGGTATYSWLRKNGFPKDNYRLLCFNCNYGRYRNGGICPHQTTERFECKGGCPRKDVRERLTKERNEKIDEYKALKEKTILLNGRKINQ